MLPSWAAVASKHGLLLLILIIHFYADNDLCYRQLSTHWQALETENEECVILFMNFR